MDASDLQASPPSESTGFVEFDWNQVFEGNDAAF